MYRVLDEAPRLTQRVIREGDLVNSVTHNKILSFIWGIADELLRDLRVRNHYRDVILSFTVLRRLDGVPEPTKAGGRSVNQDALLRDARLG